MLVFPELLSSFGRCCKHRMDH